MKTYDLVQGTPEWKRLRCGIPTASNFDKIVKSALDEKTGQLPKSTQQDRYLNTLLFERLTGEPEEEFESKYMKRGTILEGEALGWYEFQRGVTTTPVGFVTLDDGSAGCSPDRFVGDDGGVETKCPKGGNHVGYLLDESDGAYPDYIQQVQGTLWITGRKWWDVVSFHPRLPGSLVRIERDEAYIAKLASRVVEFATRLEALVDECRRRGWGRQPDDGVSFIEQRLRASINDPIRIDGAEVPH